MAAAHTAIIILAAGASSRLGQPKQLVRFNGNTLLDHAVQAAAGCAAGMVVVVLGAHAPQIGKDIGNGPIHIVENKHWQEGMASSLRCGIEALTDVMPQANAAILMLCDQPFVTAELLNELIAKMERSGKPIIASTYNGILGVPALFHKSIFPELLELQGDVGARIVIQRHMDETEVIPFPNGEVDIDTPADEARLRGE